MISGCTVGEWVNVGAAVGSKVKVGMCVMVGCTDGFGVGSCEGACVGRGVGTCVGVGVG